MTGKLRRSTAAIGVVVATLLLLPVSASAAGDELTSPWSSTGPGQTYCGTYTGTVLPANTGDHSCTIDAFMIGADIDGAPTAVFSTRADMATGDPTATATTATFPASGSGFGDNEDAAARVLVNYFPNENPGLEPQYEIAGTDDEQAAAVQAVLWHLAGDFDMDLETEAPDPTETDFVTYANYLHILAAVADGALPAGDEDLFVHLLAPADGVLTSLVVGPFTVTTSGSRVTVDPPENVDVVNASGEPIYNVFTDGSQFYLQFPGLGDYEIDATTAGIQDSQVRAWTTESAQAAVLMPLADGTSRNGTYTETLQYTVYEVQAEAATPVETDPAFTG